MIIGIASHNRFELESAVPTQDIRSALHTLDSRLVYMIANRNTLATDPFSVNLEPIAMGPNQPYHLPYELIEFAVDSLHPATPEIMLYHTPDGFRVSVKISETLALLDFDSYMNLRQLSIHLEHSAVSHAASRTQVMDVLMKDLPAVLGYLVSNNAVTSGYSRRLPTGEVVFISSAMREDHTRLKKLKH